MFGILPDGFSLSLSTTAGLRRIGSPPLVWDTTRLFLYVSLYYCWDEVNLVTPTCWGYYQIVSTCLSLSATAVTILLQLLLALLLILQHHISCFKPSNTLQFFMSAALVDYLAVRSSTIYLQSTFYPRESTTCYTNTLRWHVNLYRLRRDVSLRTSRLKSMMPSP